jgi:hypothetical protein
LDLQCVHPHKQSGPEEVRGLQNAQVDARYVLILVLTISTAIIIIIVINTIIIIIIIGVIAIIFIIIIIPLINIVDVIIIFFLNLAPYHQRHNK